MTTIEHIDQLRAAGDVVWENRRYGALYIVDRPTLEADLKHHITVLHLGQVEAVQEIRSSVPAARWLTVYIYCVRNVAQERIAARATGDTEARLQAWSETPPLSDADLTIDTGVVCPDEAAHQIHERFMQLTA
ncbi:kinase [Micromonospora sp. WMMA1363]|uniref:kinase n=1 Tax=Micromonospora sp. WMMA1363 TaxID=3053985 RepID=UPI00259CAB63|nr:kinase [Micromonospora sp. WMMA1363]MDM4722383.1 kinase [Micromonospora sp. WMMA1363]